MTSSKSFNLHLLLGPLVTCLFPGVGEPAAASCLSYAVCDRSAGPEQAGSLPGRSLETGTCDGCLRAPLPYRLRGRYTIQSVHVIQRLLHVVPVLGCIDDVYVPPTGTPQAYSAFLVEKQRRDQYGKTVHAAAMQFVQSMETYREEELRLRDEFINAHGRHLPKPFHDMPVMAAKPGRVDVTPPPPLPGESTTASYCAGAR